jgi:hypothetical protein
MTRRSEDRRVYTTPLRWVGANGRAKPNPPPSAELKQTIGAVVPDLRERLDKREEAKDIAALGDLV